ncbi:MAG: hypothetical protein IK079_03715, partial [Desulfovibrio sp.]|nr:hypothetical protein [Desulfovibrio sp.]
MAGQKAPDEILDLTELIEKGSNAPSEKPPLDCDLEQTKVNSLNDNDNTDDLDHLLAKFDKPAPNSAAKKTTHTDSSHGSDKLDMSDIEAVDTLLNNLDMSGRGKKTVAQNDFQNSIDSDLESLMASVDADTAKENQTSRLNIDSAQTENNSSSPLDDLDAIIAQSKKSPKKTPLHADFMNDLQEADNFAEKLHQSTNTTPVAPKEPEPQKVAEQSQPKETPPPLDDIDTLIAQVESKKDQPPQEQDVANDPLEDLDSMLAKLPSTAKPVSTETPDLNLGSETLNELEDLANQQNQAAQAKSPATISAVQELEKRISSCEATLKDIQDNVQKHIDSCESELANVQIIVQSLKDDMQKLAGPEQLLADDSPLMQKILALVTASIATALKNVEKDADTANQSLTDFDVRLGSLSASFDELKTKMEASQIDLEARFDPIEKNSEQLTEKLAALEQTSQDLNQHVTEQLANDETKNQIADLSSQFTELKGQLDFLINVPTITDDIFEERINPLESTLQELSTSITELKKTAQDVNQLNTSVAHIETTLVSTDKIQGIEERIEEISAQTSHLKSAITTIANQLDATNTAVANSDPQASLQNLNTQIADLNNKCALTEELKSSLSALEQKVANSDPQASLQNLNTQIADLNNKCALTEELKSSLSALEQ